MLKKLLLVLVPVLLFIFGLFAMQRITAAGNNLVPNPSAEDSLNNLPLHWTATKTGNNTTSFNYLNTGHTGSHSLQVQMTKRSSGQADWISDPINVAPSTKYTFTGWYQSSVASTLVATITNTGGATSNHTVSEPASAAWRQSSLSFTTPSRAARVVIRQYINRVGQITTDDYDLEGPAVTAPTVSLSAPADNATVSGTVNIAATADGGSSTVKSVQFLVDGANLGSADTTSPYGVSWNTAGLVNGSAHTLSAIVTTASGATATAANVTVTVNNPVAQPPTVSINTPAPNSTINGTQPIGATVSADTVGVQFNIDGANVGSEQTVSPFHINWDTTTAANGSHTIKATARNAAGLTASASETVNVQNTTTPPNTGPNLIANPSFEASSNGSAPDSWLSSSWGTNTSAFSYLNTGHTGTHSVEVQTTKYTNGAANWYYNDIPVTAGTTYQYSNWYQSNVDTEVDAEVVMTDGTTQYYWLGAVLANTNWTQFKTTFTVPAGAKSVSIYQILAKVGYIISDDYSLSTYTPAALNRALVSVTFDDGWTSQYNNAFPLLQKYNIPATFYIISGELTDQPDYMTAAQVKSLYAAGNEIGSHTVTHSDLTTVSQAQLTTEMQQSQATLQNVIGVPVTDFAYPYGAYNANTIAVGKQYYQSQRTVNQGLNTKDNFDLTQLKIYEVDSNISQAQVQGWINAAITQKAWLILLYHEVGQSIGGDIYHANTADVDAELSYIKSTGITAVTVNQAINEIQPQL